MNSTTMQNDMLNSIREIVELGIRRPGSPEDLRAEQYIEAKFNEFGLAEIRREPVPVNYWAPSATEFRFSNDDWSPPCFPVPYTEWTREEGIEAASVFLGGGSLAEFDAVDLQGKIAVVVMRFGEFSAAALKSGSHFIHDLGDTIPNGPLHAATWLFENFSAYFEAHRRGAAGFVGILANSPIDGPEQYVPYDGFLKDLLAMWVGRESAAEISDRARRGDRAVFTSAGATATIDSHNVVGVVPGTGDESILLTCHHDAPFASAVEDASGMAVLLWLAREFARAPNRLTRNLVLSVTCDPQGYAAS